MTLCKLVNQLMLVYIVLQTAFINYQVLARPWVQSGMYDVATCTQNMQLHTHASQKSNYRMSKLNKSPIRIYQRRSSYLAYLRMVHIQIHVLKMLRPRQYILHSPPDEYAAFPTRG